MENTKIGNKEAIALLITSISINRITKIKPIDAILNK